MLLIRSFLKTWGGGGHRELTGHRPGLPCDLREERRPPGLTSAGFFWTEAGASGLPPPYLLEEQKEVEGPDGGSRDV